jgi:hypothetical protein
MKNIALTTLLFLSVFPTQAAQPRFADSHIHYNWDQAELISADDVIAKLKQANVGLTIVASTPSHLALKLREAGGDWVIPFFSPYIHELGKRDWFLDDQVVTQAEAGLRQGLYFGIGEIHFMAGFAPRPDNKIFRGLMQLARRYQVPVLIHIDSSNEQYFLNICRAYPDLRLIFAHAGGNLKPRHIDAILRQCANVWVDLSARDPWRYGGLTDERHLLLPAWRDLILRYPDRFTTGTDAVWRVTRTQSWDQPDDGWDHYQQLYDFHWSWLNDLPSEVRRKIAWENPKRLLNRQ